MTDLYTGQMLGSVNKMSYGLLSLEPKDKDGNPKLDKDGNTDYKAEHTVFTTEPQLWYNVGQHFGCENLSVGSEVEISHNFGSNAGWMVRPCLGVKWDF